MSATAAAQPETVVGRRGQILDAALEAFVGDGYAATTIAHLCRLSGASVGSIYHHFGDKEGVAAALYVECLRDYQSGLAATLTAAPQAERGIKGQVRHHLRWVEANRSRASFLLGHRELAAAEQVRALNLEFFDLVRDWLRPHLEAGTIRRMPLELLYVVVIGPSQEYARHWLDDPEQTRIRAAERVLAQAAWDAVRADREET
jgi:AcrR family transcriptional regulator